MEIKNTKPMYVGVEEVCADWGVSRRFEKSFLWGLGEIFPTCKVVQEYTARQVAKL